MLLLLATRVGAEGPAPPMEKITVQASPLDIYVPAQTQIEREELTGSHKDELSDVLMLAPGMNVRQGGRGEVRVDMRGFDQRATLFTLNDVPVYEPYNGIVNLDLFPLEMLQSVEIARGPASSLFGPNGMAGTVKMRTGVPEAPLAGALSTTWRDHDLWDVRASAGLARGPVSATIGGRYLTSRGFPLSDDFEGHPPSPLFDHGGMRLNSDREEKSGFADMAYALGQGGRVHATVLASTAEFGIPPSTGVPRPDFQREDHQEFDHVQAGVDQPLGPHLDVSAAVFYSAYDTRESDFTGPDFMAKKLTTQADSEEVGGIAHVAAQLGERDVLALAGQVRNAAADISDSANGNLGNPHFLTSSAGLENLYFVTEHVRLLAGLSYDLQTGGGRDTVGEPDPEGGVSVDWDRLGTSRAGVTRKIRFPTLRELFDPQQGNAHLRPEKALVYQIGHRIQDSNWYADASLFRSDVDDLIDGGGPDQPATNLDQAVLQGAEMATGGLLARRVQVDLNYTYLDAQARQDLPAARRAFSEIQHKPVHRFNGILRFFLPAALLLRFEGRYTSSQLDQFNTTNRLDGFGVFNAQLSKAFGRHLEVFIGADNVLDANYEEKLGFPQPGRWEYAGMRARY